METLGATTDNWDAAFSDAWTTADLVDCVLSYAATELVVGVAGGRGRGKRGRGEGGKGRRGGVACVFWGGRGVCGVTGVLCTVPLEEPETRGRVEERWRGVCAFGGGGVRWGG